MLRLFLVTAMLIVPSAVAQADSPAMPRTYEVTSPNGKFVAVAAPAMKTGRPPTTGTISVFKVKGGDRTPVWAADVFHSFATFLSDDGEYVARPGDWPQGSEPSEVHRAIAFFKRDTLLKNYSTKTLIRDPSRVPRSVSHYEYAYSKRQISGFIVELVTVDCVQYHFDMRTGEITESKQLFFSEDTVLHRSSCLDEQPPAKPSPTKAQATGDKKNEASRGEEPGKSQPKGCDIGNHGSHSRTYWVFVLFVAALLGRRRK